MPLTPLHCPRGVAPRCWLLVFYPRRAGNPLPNMRNSLICQAYSANRKVLFSSRVALPRQSKELSGTALFQAGPGPYGL
jgi:hypothetical protein